MDAGVPAHVPVDLLEVTLEQFRNVQTNALKKSGLSIHHLAKQIARLYKKYLFLPMHILS